MLDVGKIVRALRLALPEQEKDYVLHEPEFSGNEWAYVKECLDTGWVSSAGKHVERFEKQVAEFAGVQYAIAVVNGTAALHIALSLLGVEQGDEVMIPALTFVATANAAVYCGAVPHLVDSEERTLGMDPRRLGEYLERIGERRGRDCYNRQTGRRIKAIVPMHTFGHPVDMDQLASVCERFHIAIVEDAAEALGSYYKGRHVGQWGRMSTVSFNGNKIITTGGGGAILTDDADLARQAKHITTTAKLPHKWAFNHDQLGYNYRMPNLNAALGCAQMERLPDFLLRKRALAARYQQRFADIAGVRFFTESSEARSNYWLNVLLLNDADAGERDVVMQELHQEGFLVRPAWTLMHRLPMYRDCPRMELPVAENLEKRIINLPSSSCLYQPEE